MKNIILAILLLTPTLSYAYCCNENGVYRCGTKLDCDPISDPNPAHTCSGEPRCLPVNFFDTNSDYFWFYAEYTCHDHGNPMTGGAICGCSYESNSGQACSPQ